MDDLFGVAKKFIIGMFVIVGILLLIRAKYSLSDALQYAKDHPDPVRSPQIVYYVGTAYFLQDRQEEAVGAYTGLLTSYPTCQYAPKALFRLGTAYQGMRKWKNAREAYKIFIKYFPKDKDFGKVSNKFEVIKFEQGDETTTDLMDIYSDLDLEANYGDSF